jgi:hypothetical protein
MSSVISWDVASAKRKQFRGAATGFEKTAHNYRAVVTVHTTWFSDFEMRIISGEDVATGEGAPLRGRCA